MTRTKTSEKSLLLVVVRVSVLFKPCILGRYPAILPEQVELAFVLDQDMDGGR